MIVVKFLVALIFSILIHELGHYFAALMYGVKAKEVSVCSGPNLTKIRANGTEFILKLFPTGGYNEWPEDVTSRINLAQSIIVNLSGVFINYIAAIIFSSIAFNEGVLSTLNKINFSIIPYIFDQVVKLDIGHIYILLENLLNLVLVNGTSSFLILLAISNFALFLINLIPIPSLDGGDAIESVVEMILSGVELSREYIERIKALVYFILYFILIWMNFIKQTLKGDRLIVIAALWLIVLILFFILIETIKATNIYKRFIKS